MTECQSGQGLRVIRFGAFSGAGPSLVNALRNRIRVDDFDVLSYRRDPYVMLGGVLSLVERGGTRQIPASKTAAWSSQVQKALTRDRLLESSCPTLFVQSILALDPPPGLRYAIYTDRIASEGNDPSEIYRSRSTEGWLQREERFLREAKIIFTMGPSTKVALTQMYGLDPARVSVVGAGSNAPVGSQPKSTRLRRLIFVGGDWGRKGGPELLEAFAGARQLIGDLELLVVGHHPEGRYPDGVTFAGRLSSEELSLAYSESDALVIPTHLEAFGLAIVEALRRGLPCIGTTVGNQEWLIGDAGVLVPPADTKALREALIALAKDYPTFRDAALRRKRILGGVMSWQVVADKILDGLLEESIPADLSLE